MRIQRDFMLIGKSSPISPFFSFKTNFSASELKVHHTPLRRDLNLPLDVSLNFQSLANKVVSAWYSAEGGALVCNKHGGVVGKEQNYRSKDLPSLTDQLYDFGKFTQLLSTSRSLFVVGGKQNSITMIVCKNLFMKSVVIYLENIVILAIKGFQ